jgi:nucleoside-diphosphate-sugar epimerase
MKVLVTGATGRLGTLACKELLQRGHEVVGTDQRFARGLDYPLKLADLRDSLAVYPLLEGCEAVVHLGNIPNLGMGPSAQVVLGDNVSINGNVFRAALDLGVRRIVFASSLQAMIRLDEGRKFDAPPAIPYFPLDGDAPANPGHNFYGLSKEFGERTLRILSEIEPQLACTSLRFPMLASDWFHQRLRQPLPASSVNFCEALAYLDFADAATLVALVVEKQAPGYHQYFPAQAVTLQGYTVEQTLSEFFPKIPLRRPAAEISALIDWSALERDFGFRPGPPLTLQLDRR